MRNNQYKKPSLMFTALFICSVLVTGCGQQDNQNVQGNQSTPASSVASEIPSFNESSSSSSEETSSESISTTTGDLEVRFGDDGEPFLMHLYENETAAAIARHVGTSDWRLPIYNYDESDAMEYYDIPSRYEIPSTLGSITSAKAGEVYYSDPNRIILFYEDAQFSGEYTKVGDFDITDEFVSAVKDNPVLEGWGNKIVLIGTVDNSN